MATIALDLDDWHIERLGAPVRVATGLNGETAPVIDNVVALRRRTR